MQLSNFSENILVPNGDIKFISDYQTLGMSAGIKPQTLSYLLQHKEGGKRVIDEQVYKVPVKKGRMTYGSRPALRYVQSRLGFMLLRLQRTINTDHLWSYKPGFNVYNHIQDVSNSKYFVECDIKKYFDHINTTKIADTLHYLGMGKRGSMLTARYLTVLRQSARGKPIRTLQQGSPASPYMSNLVGYYYLDIPILQWVDEMHKKYPRAKITYRRYCDNLVMALDGEIPMDLPKEAKQMMIDTILGAKFGYHGLRVTPNNHPKKHQKFLGVVLNDKIRIEKEKYEELRAILFNACRKGLDVAAKDYFEKNPIMYKPEYEDPRQLNKVYHQKFKMVMGGKIANITSINKNDGLALKKLLQGAIALDAIWEEQSQSIYNGEKLYNVSPSTSTQETDTVWKIEIDKRIFPLIKTYKNSSEPLGAYVNRLTAAWSNIVKYAEESAEVRGRTRTNYTLAM